MTTRGFQAGLNLTFKSRQTPIGANASFPVKPNGEILTIRLNEEWERTDGTSAVMAVRLSCSEFPLGTYLMTPGGEIDLAVGARKWPDSIDHRFDLGEPRPGPSWSSPAAARAIWRWADVGPFSLYIPADPTLTEPVEVNGTVYVVLEGIESKAPNSRGRFILT